MTKKQNTILIIGLGNPGKKYQDSRHNIGFKIIDVFAKEKNFPNFRLSQKFNAFLSEKIWGEKKIILVKPKTFMNNSGKAIKSILSFYKLLPENIFVIHDDIDINFGNIKISQNRGSAGHKGVESIIKEIGTKNFKRLRFGILPQKGKPENIEKFVLEKFTKKEKDIIKKITKKIIEKILLCLV